MDIKSFKDNGGKVFLYAPKYPASEAATEKIITEWQRKTFGATNMVLVFFLEQTIDWYRYVVRLWHHCLGSCAPIVHTMKRFSKFEELLNNTDFYIIDNLEESLDDIKIVYDRGGVILPVCSNEELFTMFEYTKSQSETLKNYSAIVHDALFSQYSPKDYEYMLYHNGLGETVAFYYSMAEYKKRNKKPVVVLCYDESRKSLLEESPYIDVVAHVPFPLYEYISVFWAKEYCMKNFMEIFYTPQLVEKLGNFDCGFGFVQAVRTYLGLANSGPMQKYETIVSESKRRTGWEVFEKWKLREGRTVWVCMDGLSNGNMMGIDFWRNLVDAIKRKHYDVIIKSEKSIIDGVPYAMLGPWETAELVSLCGNAISIPTGIICVVGAMVMDKPLNIQWVMFEKDIGVNSHMAQYMKYLPLIRRFGSNFLDAVEDFEEEIYGENINIVKRKVHKDADLDVLITELVDGLA